MNLNCDLLSDIGNVTLLKNHIINVSSDLIEPSKGFYLYWASGGGATIYLYDVKVYYGANSSEIPCNGVLTLGTSLSSGVSFLSREIVINHSEIRILTDTICYPSDCCSSNNDDGTCFSISTLQDLSSCPTISAYPASTSTVSVSPSPFSSLYDYSSSHITYSPSVTSTFFTSSMPPSPSIISSSSYPTHAPSLTSYSSATTVSSFSLLSPTISPSPLLCPAQDSQWQETAAGQNATGTCYKGTFNGQFDHLCYIHYIYLFISY